MNEQRKPTYPQQWREYNLAQTNEKAKFLELLYELCQGIEALPRKEGAGRNRLPLRDMIFCVAFKVYSTVSGRRFISDLNEANRRGFITRTPHRGSTLREEVVSAARARIVSQDDPFYTQIWNRLTPTQQQALIATVREGGTNLLSKASTKLYRLPPSTMQRALEALVARDILREEETRGSVKLRFEDPFLAAWIEMVTAKN